MTGNVSLYVGELVTGHTLDGAEFLQAQAVVNLQWSPNSHTCQLIHVNIPTTPKVYLYNWPAGRPGEVITRDRFANLLSVLVLDELFRALRDDLNQKATRALALTITMVDTYRTAPGPLEVQIAVAYQW